MLSSGSGGGCGLECGHPPAVCRRAVRWQPGPVLPRARYYNPANGIFNRMDPYAGNTHDPQSLHKYAYVHNNPINGIDPTGMFSLPSISFSVAIQSIIVGIHSFAVHRAGTRAADRYLSAYSGYLANNMPKENDNATIIVHGISPHTYGYSDDFITEMERRAPNQDYFEYVWSGFTMNGVLPSAWAINTTHNTATNGLINVVRAIHAKGYQNINIVSHSWGTVISRDTLNAGAADNINTWVTMGSPLTDDTARPDVDFWLNIYCAGDPVIWAGPAIWATGINNPGFGFLFDAPKGVVNEQLPLQNAYPGLNFGNHGTYWTDPVALDRIGGRLSPQ